MLNQKINFRIQSPLSPNHFLSNKMKDDKMKFLCMKFDLINLNFSKILTVIQRILQSLFVSVDTWYFFLNKKIINFYLFVCSIPKYLNANNPYRSN